MPESGEREENSGGGEVQRDDAPAQENRSPIRFGGTTVERSHGDNFHLRAEPSYQVTVQFLGALVGTSRRLFRCGCVSNNLDERTGRTHFHLKVRTLFREFLEDIPQRCACVPRG